MPSFLAVEFCCPSVKILSRLISTFSCILGMQNVVTRSLSRNALETTTDRTLIKCIFFQNRARGGVVAHVPIGAMPSCC